MKSNALILFRRIALGAGTIFILLWLWNRLCDRTPEPLSRPAVVPLVATMSSVPTPAVTPVSALEEKRPVTGASLAERTAVQAVVHEKLQQWFATNTGDTEKQEALTKELLSLLTAENTAEIIQELSPQEWNTPFSAGALDRWLQLDPAQAARWVATRADARDEHALIVARHLMETPVELGAYCDQLPENSWKQQVLCHASLEMVARNPVTAVDLAQRLAPGDQRTDALETIAYDWFGRDLAAAVNWANSMDDPALRERLMAVGAKAIAIADPDLAAGWLVSSVKTDGVLSETALSVVETWADQHPAQAATWVARFSTAGARREAVDLVLNHWLKSDPVAANAWIHTLPERESVIASLKAKRAEADLPPDDL